MEKAKCLKCGLVGENALFKTVSEYEKAVRIIAEQICNNTKNNPVNEIKKDSDNNGYKL